MKNDAPALLSVIIATYDRAELVARALRSLEGEFADRLEIVVVDDASTDGTAEVVRKFAQGSPSRVVLKRNDVNRGRAASLAKGVNAANARYCMLLDSDDCLLPGALDEIGRVLEGPCDGVVGFVWHCRNAPGKRIGDGFAHLPGRMTLAEMRFKQGIRGDKKEVIQATVLRESIVVPVDGERRVATLNYWINVSRHGPVELKDAAVVEKEYLPGGMSANLLKIRIRSPNGSGVCYWRALELPRSRHSLRSLFKVAANAWRFWLHGCRVPADLSMTGSAYVSLCLTFPAGAALYLYDKARTLSL